MSEPLFTTRLTITLPLARQLAMAAGDVIAQRGFSMFVAIVGEDATPVLVARMHDAQPASYEVAVAKARAAVRFRRATKAFEDRVLKDGRINLLSMPGIVAVEGGLPLVVDGQVVGAVGVSGGSGVEDGEVAAAVAAALHEIAANSR